MPIYNPPFDIDYNVITENFFLLVPEYHQMIVSGTLDLRGELELIGELTLI